MDPREEVAVDPRDDDPSEKHCGPDDCGDDHYCSEGVCKPVPHEWTKDFYDSSIKMLDNMDVSSKCMVNGIYSLDKKSPIKAEKLLHKHDNLKIITDACVLNPNKYKTPSLKSGKDDKHKSRDSDKHKSFIQSTAGKVIIICLCVAGVAGIIALLYFVFRAKKY